MVTERAFNFEERDVLAIVGSRRFLNPHASAAAQRLIEQAVGRQRPAEIISGGADGIDTLAGAIATRLGVAFHAFLPANHRWEPAGYKARNVAIAQTCTRLICIRCAKATIYGSGWTADYAEQIGRPVWRVLL